jgi:hypothetical protein
MPPTVSLSHKAQMKAKCKPLSQAIFERNKDLYSTASETDEAPDAFDPALAVFLNQARCPCSAQ